MPRRPCSPGGRRSSAPWYSPTRKASSTFPTALSRPSVRTSFHVATAGSTTTRVTPTDPLGDSPPATEASFLCSNWEFTHQPPSLDRRRHPAHTQGSGDQLAAVSARHCDRWIQAGDGKKLSHTDPTADPARPNNTTRAIVRIRCEIPLSPIIRPLSVPQTAQERNGTRAMGKTRSAPFQMVASAKRLPTTGSQRPSTTRLFIRA